MDKKYTDVVIDNKVYSVSCDQGAVYMQQLAEYMNTKLSELHAQPAFKKQPFGSRQMFTLMNFADDYLKLKLSFDEINQKYHAQETEFYNMKRELVNLRLKLEQTMLQNQVLTMGLSGDEQARQRLMTDVMSQIQETSGKPEEEKKAGGSIFEEGSAEAASEQTLSDGILSEAEALHKEEGTGGKEINIQKTSPAKSSSPQPSWKRRKG